MREKFIEYSNILFNSDNIENVIMQIKEICKKAGMYHEEGACLEKLYHITRNYSLFREIGDIFLKKLSKYDIANAAYNRYLYYNDKNFYNNFSANLQFLGCNFVHANNQDDDLPREILITCDKYDLVAYMIIYLNNVKDYEGIIILSAYLRKLKDKILFFGNMHSINSCLYLDDVIATERHLSHVLSNSKSNYNINQLAIELDKTNQKAYINIIEDFLLKVENSKAIEFYNNSYINNFGGIVCASAEILAWIVSDYYRDNFLFYNSIKMQKQALETALNI